MSKTVDPEQIASAAQAALGDRVNAVRTAADALGRLQHAREQLTAAEDDYRTTRAAAERAGWTARELKTIGLEPAPSGARRSRGRTGSATPPADSPAGG